jgi:hypothetical protein
MVRVRAVKPINAGDELTIGYTQLTSPQAERQQELLKKYDFRCDCVACRFPARVSDARRARLNHEVIDQAMFQLFLKAKTWTRSQVLKVQDDCGEIFQLVEQEHLGWTLRIVAVRKEWLAYTYALLGNKEKFVEHTKEAIFAWEASAGKRTETTPLEGLKRLLVRFKRVGPSVIPNWGACA